MEKGDHSLYHIAFGLICKWSRCGGSLDVNETDLTVHRTFAVASFQSAKTVFRDQGNEPMMSRYSSSEKAIRLLVRTPPCVPPHYF